ncbi:MAG TPA: hypothetical protein VK841_23690 [Polyangiaceae bacterium]|jgi:hypothetical protein|nr:hypothetical protein [Polyangiaceae bacterium]
MVRSILKAVVVVVAGSVLSACSSSNGTGPGADGGPSSDASLDSSPASNAMDASPPEATDSSLLNPMDSSSPGTIDSSPGVFSDAAPIGDASETEADGGPLPVVLVDGLTNPSYIVSDGINVYFTTYDSAAMSDVVMLVGTDGGAASTLAVGVGIAGGLAVYQGTVYWTNSVGDAGGSVMAVGLDGGGPTTIAAGQTYPAGPAVDGTGIYWSQDVADGGSVMVAPFGGGAPSIVAADQNSPNALTVLPTGLFWLSLDGIEWSPAPSGSGTPITLGQIGVSNNGPIAADSNAVYTLSECTVYRTPLDGGTATPLAPPSFSTGSCLAAGTTIAVDDASAYWPIRTGSGNPLNSGSVVSASLAGGGGSPAGAIASGQNGPNNVAVDALHVYWTNHGVNGQPGQVMRANKP